MTLKEHMSGEAPNFTNHAGHETQNDEEENRAQNFEHHHQHLQVSRTDVAKPHQFLCTSPEICNARKLNIQDLHQVFGLTHP